MKKKQRDYSKYPWLAHIDSIKERINRRTSVLVVKFNEVFEKIENFYMEYVTKVCLQ